jgi:hypothetical protein
VSGETPPRPADPADLRVAEVLQRVRSGVRQRQAELATLAGGGEETKLRLLELKSLEYVEEPPLFSHRPGVGRLIVFVRKAVFHLFLKWYTRPMLLRQNRFNQAASQLLHELVARQAKLAETVARLTRELEEARGDEAAGTSPAPGSASNENEEAGTS